MPYCVPAWGWAEHWAILKCLLTGKLIDGPDIKKLYDRIREVTGVKYVFGFNSGQEAIQAALTAGGVGNGDYVIMPSYCCETVAKAIVNSGANPLFCDIGDDLNPDVDHILRLINSSVKAIIFPHLFGNPGAIDRLKKELEKNGQKSRILLIDDAAQSFGAKLNGRFIGTFGDAGMISFAAGKTMTATGGGLLITDSRPLAENIRKLEVDVVSIENKLKRLLYWVFFRRWRTYTLPFFPFIQPLIEQDAGVNKKLRNLCNMDATLALRQLKKLDRLLSIRIGRKKYLDQHLKSGQFNGLRPVTPISIAGLLPVATKYLISVEDNAPGVKKQDHYKEYMKENGIEIQDLYFPNHLKKKYAKETCSLPATEKYYTKLIQIPIEPSMDRHKFHFVIKKFNEYFESKCVQ